uniref:Uncharacterized protein n=1 Tax=Arundo donax TaxID=35708 RepID=A0A0A8ZKK7_ARUDO
MFRLSCISQSTCRVALNDVYHTKAESGFVFWTEATQQLRSDETVD